MKVNVGDVVLAKYKNFDGEVVLSMFVVIYHERVDIPTSNKFTGAKISSTFSGYPIDLDRKYLRFLDHDCYLNSSTQLRFSEKEVIDVIGKINKHVMNKLIIQLTNYHSRMVDSLKDILGKENLFKVEENKQEGVHLYEVR